MTLRWLSARPDSQPDAPGDEAGGEAGLDGTPGPAAAAAGRRQPDPWRTAFFGVLLLGILAVAAWALLGSSLLVVRHVRVTGNHLVSAAEVRAAAEIRMGTPLARVDGGAVAGRVERIAQVLTATVSRSWPNTIVITVTERTPVLAVSLVGGRYGLIDAHGVVVREAAHPPAGMPLLTSPPAALRGSPAIQAAAAVLRQLPASLRQRVRSVSAASATTVTLHLRRGIRVLWGGAGQARQKAEELDQLFRTHARYYDVSDPATAVTNG